MKTSPRPHRSALKLSPGTQTAASRVITGPVRHTLLWLALPVFGEQLLNSFVAIVDTFLAGRISTDATAAVGLAAYVDWLASMLFALVGTGTTALVSRAAGTGDATAAQRITNQSMTLSVITGLVFSGALFALAPLFADLQNMTGATYDIAVQYMRLDATAMTFTSLTLVGAAALRGAGDTRTPMAILGGVNILNALASFALVFGWGPLQPYGVTGIVVGTVIARVAGGLLMVGVLIRGRSSLRLRRSMLALKPEPVHRILRIGGPAAFDGAVMWTGHFLFLMIVARLAEGQLGHAYYAAHIIGVRLEAFTYLPAMAWAAAAATMIGQNLGADQPDRARRAGHEAALQCAVLTSVVGVFFFLAATQLFAFMHKEPLVRQVGTGPFRMVALLQPVLAISIVYIGSLRGAGDTRFPLLITVTTLVLVRLPLGYLFGATFGWGLWGAWMAMCADFIFRGGLASWHFARGKWIHVRV
ncbi:MAG: MATE family efflux transporter [Phycisphaerae bacterium]